MKLKKDHNSNNDWRILFLSWIEPDQYFMKIYLCIKYESNTLIFSKILTGNWHDDETEKGP